MKESFIKLISEGDDIQKLFYKDASVNGLPNPEKIYDVPAFSVWKQSLLLELQRIYDRTKDKFIWETLVMIRQGFNGWRDRQSFNELSGSLGAIQNDIDHYFPAETTTKTKVEVKFVKTPKIFISHSSKDERYIKVIVDFLDSIGLSANDIFCTSIPGYGIPLNKDIYSYLKDQFLKHDLHVFFVLSDNYYDSAPCLNEMGAAWVLQSRYTTVLLPGFKFEKITGALNPRQIGLKLDNNDDDLKTKLEELKNVLSDEFGLGIIPPVRWEEKRDDFIKKISLLNN